MSYTDYLGAHDDYVNRYRYRYANAQAISTTQVPTTSPNGQYASGISDSGLFANTCTDGSDDGQISGVSKFLNICEGVLGMGVNMVKGAIKHPFKTAITMAACCIPVVGPAIGIGLGCYGVYNSVKQIGTALEVANSATTDAEAKAAFENIGSGTAGAALSAVAIKGSAGIMKNQLKGLKKVYNKGGTATADKMGAVGKAMGKQTMANMKNVFGAPFRKGKEIYDGIKQEGLTNYAKGQWTKLKDKVVAKTEGIGRKIGEKIDASKEAKSTLESLKEAAKNPNSGVVKQNGKYYKTKNGVTTEYSSRGVKLSETRISQGANVGDTTKTTEYKKNGETIKTVEETTTVTSKGKKVVTETTQNGTTTKETVQYDTNGKVVNKAQTTTDTTNNIKTIESKTKGQSHKINTETGYKTVTQNGKTKYYKYNKDTQIYEELTNLTAAQKAQIQKSTSSSYQNFNRNFNRFLDEPLTFGKNVIPDGIPLTNKRLAAMGILKEMDE